MLAALVVVGLGAVAYQAFGPGIPLRPQVAEVVPAAPAVRRVQALGQVLPVSDLVIIAAPTGPDVGRIASISVAEGDRVAAGRVLAVLDTEPLLKAQLDQAIATETLRRAALEVRVADIEATAQQLEAQIAQQQVALDLAQLELDRKARLRDTGLYEDSALRDLQLGVQAAEYVLRHTQVQLDRNRMTTADGLRLDEASATAELAAATAARVKAEADYAKAFIRAPIDGRVLGLFGRVGQQIDNAGFGEMGDTRHMAVRAEVYETDIVALSVGQRAEVTSRAFDGLLTGQVSRIGVRIAGQTILSTDPAAIVDARVIEVWIRLDEGSSAAVADRTGLQVTAAFAAAEDGDV